MINPYRCQHLGCHKSFPQQGILLQHTQDSHRNDSTVSAGRQTFKCGYINCSRGFPQLRALEQHMEDSHKKQQPVYGCGVLGCGENFPQLKLLHDHTEKVHPKAKRNQFVAPQTLVSSPGSFSPPPSPQSTQRSDFSSPNAEDQRLLALEQELAQGGLVVSSTSPPPPLPTINKSKLKVYRKYVELAEGVILGLRAEDQISSLWERLREIVKTMENLCNASDTYSSSAQANPYRCRHPGCNKSFVKQGILIQHTRDSHGNDLAGIQTFKCGSCNRSFPQLRALEQHIEDSHKEKPQLQSPKPPVYQCGVPGCGANFLQLKLLHDHTEKFHPKPRPIPFGRQQTARSPSTGSFPTFQTTSSSFPSSPVWPPPSVRSTQGSGWVDSSSPLRMASEDRYPKPAVSSPPLYSRGSSIPPKGRNSTASPSQNMYHSTLPNDLTPNAEDQRLLALEREMAQVKFMISSTSLPSPLPMINKSKLKVYRKYVELAERVISDLSGEGQKSSLWERLREIVKTMENLDDISSLVCSARFRIQVDQLLKVLDYTDKDEIKLALDKDNDHAFYHVLRPLFTTTGETKMLALREEEAKAFMDVLENCIRKSNNKTICDGARRMLRKLSDLCHGFPPSIFITGVHLTDSEHFDGGGFADVFRGDYNGQHVVLKRIRVFPNQTEDGSKVLQGLRREVLTWSNLDPHPFVLPFLGLSEECFPQYPPCIVAPYMHEGTILHFIKNHQLTDRSIDTLISEIAQGLHYLHSNNVVHGDLRGGNILINDLGHIQLADFGLAAVSNATHGSHSTSKRHGSIRWMAPELHSPEEFELKFERTAASDVYAFACSTLEIYTEKLPFHEIPQDSAVMLRVIRKERPLRPSGPLHEPREMVDELWKIIEACWAHQPTARPTMDKVLDMMKEFDFGV